MKPNQIEQILANEKKIEPSPGFAHAVMSAVHREATSLPPLKFPWLRALPGFMAMLVALGAAMWNVAGTLNDPAAATTLTGQWAQAAAFASGYGLQWIALAAVVALIATSLPSVLVRGAVTPPSSRPSGL